MKKKIKFKRLGKVIPLNPTRLEAPVGEIQHSTNRRRYLFTFPPETNIGTHLVTSVSNMRMKRDFIMIGSEWDDLVIKFTEELSPILFNDLIHNMRPINVKLEQIDPLGGVIERWEMNVIMIGMEFEDLIPKLTFRINNTTLFT